MCKCGVTLVVLYMYCMQGFILIEIVGVIIRSHCLRLVAIGYQYATGCHDNGNVELHVCAKFHYHTYTQCFMLIVKG